MKNDGFSMNAKGVCSTTSNITVPVLLLQPEVLHV